MGPGVAVVPESAIACVLVDRVDSGGDFTGTLSGFDEQRLQCLEPVSVGAATNALAYHGIEIDQNIVAQQVVDLLLSDAVSTGETQQRALLVGRVVVDMHSRIAATALGHQLQKCEQGLAFGAAIVGPNGPEFLISGSVVFEHAEQVLQPPMHAVLGPQRVALEVEEDVTRIGGRQRAQRDRIGHLELWCATVALANL
ncbi:Uncharacterised protein [Mycobacteroides abscessus]|nr:Uncharacterised protein [Mycobacteroides abscessus]SIJ17898.1 Uncharacterised protein [Mycobacteroides abscessus subsp. abscessus]